MKMAKNDYFVIVYRFLAYLYECLKEGEKPNLEYLQPKTDSFPVNKSYWEYIINHLLEDGYIEGVDQISVLGRTEKLVKMTQDIMITPLGIEFLQDNSNMSKAKEFLKTLKEIIPGL